MPNPRPILGVTFAALLASIVASARAEEATYTTTWSQEALAGVEQPPESAELRALRLAEEELFAQKAKLPGTAGESDPEVRAQAEVAASEGPEPPRELERDGRKVDLSFLKGLKLPSIPVRWDPRVVEYLLFFKEDARGRELALGWLKRQERYGPMIRAVLAQHSLPPDLQYVAMIESGYDPEARSNADAFGMWQFLQQPAEYYGLRVDHWVDERLDPERATAAAARFMADLYERFGCWELSFAAYNMGYGGLLRAIRKYNSNDYWLLSHLEAGLPFETSLYVAKITAMAIVAHNPAAFGFEKLQHEPTLKLAKVDVQAGTSLKQIASAAGIGLEQLQAVNPHLKRTRIPPGEPTVHVYLPREARVTFAQSWSLQRDDGKPPLAHVVRFGETLDDVARRAGISVQKLRELNELPADARVSQGFSLFVPGDAKPTSDLVEALVASVPDKQFQYEGRRRIFYRVGPQDTPSSVARFFDVTLDELNSWNHLAEGAALHGGMLLQLFVVEELDLSRAVVYRPEEVRMLTIGSDAFFDYHEAQRGRARVRYRVQPSDTLSELAERFELSVGSIARINQFPSQRELKAGEWLTVYLGASEADKLAALGLIERIGDAQASASDTTRMSDEEDELPEVEGEPLVAPRKEAPLTPPKKTRGAITSPDEPGKKRVRAAPRPATKKAP